MLSILYKPYPLNNETWKNLKFNIVIGFFVAFFLIVFEPFGLSSWQTNHKIIKLAGYGFIAFVVPTILFFLRDWLIVKYNYDQKYAVIHEIFFLLLILMNIAFFNCVYISYLHKISFTVNLLMYVVFMVSAIGLFPIMASAILKHNHFLALNVKDAEILENLTATNIQSETLPTKHSGTIVLIAENGKDKLELDPNDLLYLESLENYITIYHQKDGQLSKSILRSTLKRMEEQIDQPSIERCHRSFIINLDHVTHFTGNAQGYMMSLANTAIKIPVSRSYGPPVLEKMKQIKG